MELTQVPSYTHKTTQASHTTYLSNIGGNARNQILAQEIINMEAQFGMTYNLYCYKKPELSDDKDDCYITRAEEDEKDKKDRKDENT